MKAADLVAAVLCALWAVVVLPWWKPAADLLNDDFLLIFGALLGLILLTGLAAVTGTALAVAGALVMGDVRGRIGAMVIGAVTAVGALCYLVQGSLPTLAADPWSLAAWLLGFAGGPVLLVLTVGSSLDELRRRRPRTVLANPQADVTPTPQRTEPTSADEFWTRSQPEAVEQARRTEPFWADLTPLTAVVVGLLFACTLIGAYFIGDRWRVGPHPVIGAAMVLGSIAVGWSLDLRRRRGRQ